MGWLNISINLRAVLLYLEISGVKFEDRSQPEWYNICLPEVRDLDQFLQWKGGESYEKEQSAHCKNIEDNQKLIKNIKNFVYQFF